MVALRYTMCQCCTKRINLEMPCTLNTCENLRDSIIARLKFKVHFLLCRVGMLQTKSLMSERSEFSSTRTNNRFVREELDIVIHTFLYP